MRLPRAKSMHCPDPAALATSKPKKRVGSTVATFFCQPKKRRLHDRSAIVRVKKNDGKRGKVRLHRGLTFSQVVCSACWSQPAVQEKPKISDIKSTSDGKRERTHKQTQKEQDCKMLCFRAIQRHVCIFINSLVFELKGYS